MNYWEKILEGFSFKSKGGAPDFTNPNDRMLLRMELLKKGWNEDAVNELMYRLTEARSKEQEEYLKSFGEFPWGKPNKKGIPSKIQLSTALSYASSKNFQSQQYKQSANKKAKLFLTQKSTDGDQMATDILTGKETEKKGVVQKIKKKIKGGVQTTIEQLKKNRDNIFNNTVSGKGGGKTSVQEEIAGISRDLAHQYPDDSPEEHREKVKSYITDNYGDSHWGSKEKTIDGLIKKSSSGHKTMSKVKNNKGTKFSDKQPKGLPKNLTFTDGGTAAIRESVEDNLEKAKKSGDKEAIEHYERELIYFIKHATSETGVEGDGDTAMMYQDTDGRIRILYISNKQGLKDPHSNATVKSTAKSIRESRQKGANETALISRLEGSVDEAIDANAVMVKEYRESLDKNKKELKKAPLTDIASSLLTGRAEHIDKTSRKYLDNCKKNDQVKEYIKKNNLDDKNDAHVVQAALAVAGSGGADGLNDSNKQAPNKLLLKMTNATASIRRKMEKLIAGGMSVKDAAKAVSEKKDPASKKPLMGGNLTTKMATDIYNNKALKELEEKSQDRKAKMDDAHKKMYNSVVELDVAHYMDSEGLTEEEAIKKYNKQSGPNEQTYTLSFLKRMHWDRYLDGVDDNKKMIEIGDQSFSPKDFRDCLAEKSGYDLESGDGEGLKQHILKNMRIVPGSMELKFVDKKGKEMHLGNDTWRTAGDLSKVAGSLGKDMQKCLGTK
tara:strand:+ start:248 stop:2416 length:2169 start_codon:yes stop_codon:yes gene_type:complete